MKIIEAEQRKKAEPDWNQVEYQANVMLNGWNNLLKKRNIAVETHPVGQRKGKEQHQAIADYQRTLVGAAPGCLGNCW